MHKQFWKVAAMVIAILIIGLVGVKSFIDHRSQTALTAFKAAHPISRSSIWGNGSAYYWVKNPIKIPASAVSGAKPLKLFLDVYKADPEIVSFENDDVPDSDTYFFECDVSLTRGMVKITSSYDEDEGEEALAMARSYQVVNGHLQLTKQSTKKLGHYGASDKQTMTRDINRTVQGINYMLSHGVTFSVLQQYAKELKAYATKGSKARAASKAKKAKAASRKEASELKSLLAKQRRRIAAQIATVKPQALTVRYSDSQWRTYISLKAQRTGLKNFVITKGPVDAADYRYALNPLANDHADNEDNDLPHPGLPAQPYLLTSDDITYVVLVPKWVHSKKWLDANAKDDQGQNETTLKDWSWNSDPFDPNTHEPQTLSDWVLKGQTPTTEEIVRNVSICAPNWYLEQKMLVY